MLGKTTYTCESLRGAYTALQKAIKNEKQKMLRWPQGSRDFKTGYRKYQQTVSRIRPILAKMNKIRCEIPREGLMGYGLGQGLAEMSQMGESIADIIKAIGDTASGVITTVTSGGKAPVVTPGVTPSTKTNWVPIAIGVGAAVAIGFMLLKRRRK
jgi:LPXTG-motif cell wall-anchored protein